MTEGGAFYGSPGDRRRRDGWVTTLALAVLVAGVGLAIVKPWGSTAQPTPSSAPPVAVATPAASAPDPVASDMPEPAPTGEVVPLPAGFTTSPLPTGTWTRLDWRHLAPDDPLTLVASVVRWRGGYVALGRIEVPPQTPVWTSADGRQWDPLPFNTATTFWPGLHVLGVAERPTALVALTEMVEFCGEPCPLTFIPPVVAWTSTDARAWTPNILPPEWLAKPAGQQPLVADGPAGIIVAASGPGASLAISTDGTHWTHLPAKTLPATFRLDDLRGTPAGYVAIGRSVATGRPGGTASLWSADGRRWSRSPALLPTSSPPGGWIDASAASLIVGRDGLVAVGSDFRAPGGVLWWHSDDGRRWQAVPTFEPLRPQACAGPGVACTSEPDGTIVGDGQADRRAAWRRGGRRPGSRPTAARAGASFA